MNCPNCGDRMKVTNGYSNAGGHTSRGECRPCDRQFTLITIVAAESHGGVERGQGAKAFVKKMAKKPKIIFDEE